jgi:erythromycin esterase-like protein
MSSTVADQAELQSAAVAVREDPHTYDRLLARIGDARFVLLGEATHGTHEFYRERCRITKRLLEEKHFDAIAVEADWPDAHRVHSYISGRGTDPTTDEALGGFTRFPSWMWRNTDIRDLVGFLRLNQPRVGFYGLDLYSLQASADHVVSYLEYFDPEAAARARARYACFDQFGKDTGLYAHLAGLGLSATCERAAAEQLVEMHERALTAREEQKEHEEELHFHAEQNAWVVMHAEEYYRTLLAGPVASWNVRDRHMADTLAALVQHLDRRLGRACKVVVWEHNSHLGDARATEMSERGELSVGQLVRERYGRDAFAVGFTTYGGTVMASADWGAQPREMVLRPAIAGSHERLLHDFVEYTHVENVLFLPDEDGRLPNALRKERLERAIGVVYRPQTERASHWFRARLGNQFDAVIHLDRTSAVTPLDPARVERLEGEPPETYPFGV